MPQIVFLHIVDVILSMNVQHILDALFAPSKFLFEAARPKTQEMDLISGISLFVEKTIHLNSEGAIAQADIKQHYGTLDVILIARWMVDHGFPSVLAAACVRHQLLPPAQILIAGYQALVCNRTRGGLTGSRLAGQLGRIPVQLMFRDLQPQFSQLGWKSDGVALFAASFVDNLCFLGPSLYKTTQRATCFLCTCSPSGAKTFKFRANKQWL